MKFSYNWLKELLPDLQHTPEQVAQLLTQHAFEVEVVGELTLDPNVVAVEITNLQPHPNADRLRLATVLTGQETVTVVCGAPNIAVGQKVPFSPPGTTLVDDTGKKFTLQTAKIRGVVSPGMLNSPRELGFGNWHGGIYVLPASISVGEALVNLMPNDTILEADITPNRAADASSHVGLAREIAALLKLKVTEPKSSPLPEESSALKLTIDVPEQVLRYQAITLEGVKNEQSPLWLQARLWAVGARPINAVVDISNYVMFEHGNPSHTFDADKLGGKNLGVTFAQENAKLRTIDSNEVILNNDNLIITNDDTPIALAGVMGGQATAVTEATNKVVLEIANFLAYTVYQSSKTSKLQSESAQRFSRGLSPALVPRASQRLVYLLQEITGAQATGRVEYYPNPRGSWKVTLRPERVNAIAGTVFELEEVYNILTQIGCTVTRNEAVWEVVPPAERLDLQAEHDLVEEVIRVAGLEKINATSTKDATKLELPDTVKWREIVRSLLVEAGMTETYNYSFDNERIYTLLEQAPTSDRLEIINPPAPEQRFLRATLLPRLLEQVAANKAELRRKFSNTERALFEIATVFKSGTGGRVERVIEEEHIAGVWVNDPDMSQAKQVVQQVLDAFGVPEHHELIPMQMLNPRAPLARKIGLPVSMFEVNLSQLIQVATVTPEYQPVSPDETTRFTASSKFPPTYRDLSVLVDPAITVDQIEEIIQRVGGELITDVDLFDEYEPANATAKGFSFHIAYQSADRTLRSEEIAELHNKIVASLREELGLEVRD